MVELNNVAEKRSRYRNAIGATLKRNDLWLSTIASPSQLESLFRLVLNQNINNMSQTMSTESIALDLKKSLDSTNPSYHPGFPP